MLLSSWYVGMLSALQAKSHSSVRSQLEILASTIQIGTTLKSLYTRLRICGFSHGYSWHQFWCHARTRAAEVQSEGARVDEVSK